MPLDAICLEAVADELRAQLVNGRIDKVYQPERDELGLAIRTQTLGNVRLLISVNQANCRLHITRQTRENPATPPMFCMLMRKHLIGARIMDIVQPVGERVVQLVLEATNDFGDRVRRVLVAELMGRHSNLILVDEENRIVECVRRVDYEMSERRPVLPGLFYHLPPTQDKCAPCDFEAWQQRFSEADTGDSLDRWMFSNVSGISPLVARELAFRVTGQTSPRIFEVDTTAFWASIETFIGDVQKKKWTPCLLREGARPKEFSYLSVTQYGQLYDTETPRGFSELLDTFYTERDTQEHRQKRASGLRKTVQTTLERTHRKLSLQAEEYTLTLGRERQREYGDLLMANLTAISRGASKAVVEDFYDPQGTKTEIPLNVALSPQQNAAKYYKNYSKAKNAQEMLKIHIERGNIDVKYLESVLEALERVTSDSDIQDIRDELVSSGFLSAQKGKKQTSKPSKPMVFRSISGMNIYVGRNNRQNDELTLRTADKTDTWLHVQKIPGCHVIIDSRHAQPDDETLTQAAILAATYSQGRNGQKVPVDYTLVKYVKKLSGGKPGMVTYERFKTLIVDPNPSLAETLRVKNTSSLGQQRS